jgi:hypothetical protein
MMFGDHGYNFKKFLDVSIAGDGRKMKGTFYKNSDDTVKRPLTSVK